MPAFDEDAFDADAFDSDAFDLLDGGNPNPITGSPLFNTMRSVMQSVMGPVMRTEARLEG